MAGLMSKSYKELYERMSMIFSDKELGKFMGDVIRMGKKYFSIHAWEKEKLDALVQDNIREEAIEEGHAIGLEKGLAEGRAEGLAEGRAEGLAEGRAEGVESSKIEMIKNMLEENYEYESISKISGKTVEEIKEIEESMKEE